MIFAANLFLSYVRLYSILRRALGENASVKERFGSLYEHHMEEISA
jgi:hypothetical protein